MNEEKSETEPSPLKSTDAAPASTCFVSSISLDSLLFFSLFLAFCSTQRLVTATPLLVPEPLMRSGRGNCAGVNQFGLGGGAAAASNEAVQWKKSPVLKAAMSLIDSLIMEEIKGISRRAVKPEFGVVVGERSSS